ncbi:MAG TPA: DUF1269 domain-containing protein [Solirubrobacterales bacterium]|nr:DUF1269 domain-containing protein [Thermoleophilia bacterium]HVO54577.1 DUF1269 domain-containing protein [Solirubrobacterales bacterium]
MSDDAKDSVVVVTFDEDPKAYEALTRLKELDSKQQVKVVGAEVVERQKDGSVVVKDQISEENWEVAAGGGIVGLLVGVIGGPVGILLGGATGVLVGSLFDLQDADWNDSVLGEISGSVRPGRTTLVAQVTEQSPDALDAAMAELSGTVLRRDLFDVEAELSAADLAQEKAKKEARKVLREQKRAEHKEKVDAKIEELKAKVHRPSSSGTPAS